MRPETDVAVVIPAPGDLSATARRLLELADSPRDVRTTGNGTEFLVPSALADAYNGKSATPPPQPKRRGRPPKTITEEA